MKSRSLTLIFVTILLASMLWACTGAKTTKAGTLTFTSLTKGETITSPENPTQPGIVVLSDPSRLSDSAAGLVDDVKLAELKKSIEAGQLVVIVYAPQQSTSGYRISVESIEAQGNTVNVKTATESASDGKIGNQVLSYPYQIILVEKSKVPEKANWVIDNTQSTQPIKVSTQAATPTLEVVNRSGGTEELVQPTLETLQEGVTSIARGDTPITQAQIEKPTLVIAKEFADVEAYLPGSLDPAVIEKLKKAPDDGMLIMIVYRGMMSTGGYGIAVHSITTADGQVSVSVVLTQPSGQAALQVISYPYEILLISTHQVQAPAGTIWKLIDADGNLLTQTTYP